MDVDDPRPVNGVPPQAGGPRQVERSHESENDLEDHGGGGSWSSQRRKREREDERARAASPAHPVADEPTPHLVQALDRMRTTRDGVPSTDSVRRLRGQKHYREDPTTGFYHRSSTGRPPAPPSAALERRPPAEGEGEGGSAAEDPRAD